MGTPTNIPAISTIAVTTDIFGNLIGSGTGLFAINSGLAYSALSGLFGSIGAANTGVLTGVFYPLNSNPQNFVKSSQTGSFITNNQTGNFITTSQTGAFGGSTQTGTLTGVFYPLNNPSGFITTGQTGAFGSAVNTGKLTGTFLPIIPVTSGTFSSMGLSGTNLISTGAILINGSSINANLAAFTAAYNITGTNLVSGMTYIFSNPSGYHIRVFDYNFNPILNTLSTGPILFKYTGQGASASNGGYSFANQTLSSGQPVGISFVEMPYVYVGSFSGDGSNLTNLGFVNFSGGSPSNLVYNNAIANVVPPIGIVGNNGHFFEIQYASNNAQPNMGSTFNLRNLTDNTSVGFTDINFVDASNSLRFAIGVSTNNYTGTPFLYQNPYIECYDGSGMFFVKSPYVMGGTDSNDFIWFKAATITGSNTRVSSNEIMRVSAANNFISGSNLVVSGAITGYSLTLTGPNTFVLSSQTGNFITTSQTGAFGGSANTGVLTGVFYSLSNPSGFITTGQTGSFGGSANTGALTGAFYPLNANPSAFISSGQTIVLTNVPYISKYTGISLNATGTYTLIAVPTGNTFITRFIDVYTVSANNITTGASISVGDTGSINSILNMIQLSASATANTYEQFAVKANSLAILGGNSLIFNVNTGSATGTQSINVNVEGYYL